MNAPTLNELRARGREQPDAKSGSALKASQRPKRPAMGLFRALSMRSMIAGMPSATPEESLSLSVRLTWPP